MTIEFKKKSLVEKYAVMHRLQINFGNGCFSLFFRHRYNDICWRPRKLSVVSDLSSRRFMHQFYNSRTCFVLTATEYDFMTTASSGPLSVVSRLTLVWVYMYG